MSGKLKMLSAGAGAGKTSRLSAEIVNAIKSGVHPENIMATTFTTKAAEELVERVRLELLKAGEKIAAARILDGYVGTMNSVFGRLIQEFALEEGMSPVQKVLPEIESAALFNNIAAEVIEKYYRDYWKVFYRLGQDDWRKRVLKIIELARQNGLNANDVKECSDYSWVSINACLPDTLLSSEDLDKDLKSALEVANSQIPEADKTKDTIAAKETINYALREFDKYGCLPWQQWAKLSKLKTGAKSREVVSCIHAAASVHVRHPGLHRDMKDIMYALFHCASEAMKTYAEEKAKRGLIDFTDQESLALNILRNKYNLELLKDRISEVFVDEFQDSSPLQIALNMQLREIADKATWVGDVKQAIYGFRGTDPELMRTARKNISDIEIEVLDESYRSRKSLVDFVNKIFVPVFEANGMSADEIKLSPKRNDEPEQAVSLETWTYLNSRKKETDVVCLALGVRDVLSQSNKYMVVDRNTLELRSLKPGDVAILCRSNDDCSDVAEALANLGIPATVGESGLLDTPEVIYAVAGLRYLVDKNDKLALAELLHFSSEQWREGRWLSEWLETEDPLDKFNNEPIVREIDIARNKIFQMSPSEVLDLALVTARVHEVTLRA